MTEPAIWDIVKLGPNARETHLVVSRPSGGTVTVKQHTTGKLRRVAVHRCVVIGHDSSYDPKLHRSEEDSDD